MCCCVLEGDALFRAEREQRNGRRTRRPGGVYQADTTILSSRGHGLIQTRESCVLPFSNRCFRALVRHVFRLFVVAVACEAAVCSCLCAFDLVAVKNVLLIIGLDADFVLACIYLLNGRSYLFWGVEYLLGGIYAIRQASIYIQSFFCGALLFVF